jgi:hypothetical protein
MNYKHRSRAGVVATTVAMLLLGCGTAQRAPVPEAPRPGFGARAGWARQSVLDSRLPPAAQAALAQLGMVAAGPDTAGDRGTSLALPHTIAANHEYSGPGDAGYIGHSLDVGLSPFGMSLAPSGPDYPNNFSYIIYRIDDLAQAQNTLDFSFGLLPPGAQVGVAAYNWAYGSLGRWEPLYLADAVDGLVVTFNGASSEYVSPGQDLVFALFCLHPDSLELESIEVTTSDPHPDYDEVEPNDVFDDFAASRPLAGPLPAFPFTGWRGNIGSGGQYDGSVDDYFAFSGTVGEMYKFTITPEFPSAAFQPYAWDDDGFEIGEYITDPLTGAVTLTVLITSGQTQPLYVNVWHQGLATDYTIAGERVVGPLDIVPNYGEQEDNDDATNAQDLGVERFVLAGNIGQDAGFPFDHDGDRDDYYRFQADAGEQPMLVMWYDSANLPWDFPNFPPRVEDSVGTTVCFGEDAMAVYGIPDALVFRFPAPIDNTLEPPFTVNLEPPVGGSNYWFVRFKDVNAP